VNGHQLRIHQYRRGFGTWRSLLQFLTNFFYFEIRDLAIVYFQYIHGINTNSTVLSAYLTAGRTHSRDHPDMITTLSDRPTPKIRFGHR
jgi:hypothetical protein